MARIGHVLQPRQSWRGLSITAAFKHHPSSRDSCYKLGMALSARNQLPGTVEEIQIGEIVAHVVVNVGGHHVESVITRNSAEDLKLKKGDKVKVVIKSTEVMIQKD